MAAIMWTKMVASMWTKMTQTKHVDMEDTNTRLKRCLTLKRLIFIGVGKTVGVGIYVLIGEATKVAGPSVIVAFLLAFLVTLLNGLCFAEYASKNPKTGAQYTYIYETIGEAFAFLVGWTSITGFTAAFSMASRGWSGYVDSLFNHTIQSYTLTHIADWTANGSSFPQYPDLTAIVIILVAMVIVSVPLMPWIPVTCMLFNLLMLVSVIDKGSLVATVIMTVTGAVIYLAIVVYDVKVKPKSVTIFEENIKLNERMRLLTEDEEINVETTH